MLQRANAEAALLLLQNISCDKLCRHAVVKAGGIELLLQLLAANHVMLKQQHPKVGYKLGPAAFGTAVGTTSRRVVTSTPDDELHLK